MSRNKEKRIIDTNVPVAANRAVAPMSIPEDELPCVMACITAIESIVNSGGLVIDAGDEIFNEYRANLRLQGQPGVGDKFIKWVHDKRWGFPSDDRVTITKNGVSYNEFPQHAGLQNFDISDRKFVAVANGHPLKPPILEATDSKWWGWKNALKEVGIDVIFTCESFIRNKYMEKME